MKNKIELESIESHDLEEVYELYKECLFEFVDQTFGWNDQYQRARFQSCYAPETIFWVLDHTGKRTAMVCYSSSDPSLHLALLLVYEVYRGSGFGSDIMERLEHVAATEGKPITLSTFKVNRSALSFYQARGYKVIGQDEHFYDMSKATTGS